MSQERPTDFALPKLDDLFTSQNERDNGMLPDIQDIPLSLLDDFPNHPFKVRDDEDMLKLTESISERGVLVPINPLKVIQRAKFKGICDAFVLKVHSFLTYDRIKKHITGNGSANAAPTYFVEAGKTPRVINLYAVASIRYE